jgi:hypothetical protein
MWSPVDGSGDRLGAEAARDQEHTPRSCRDPGASPSGPAEVLEHPPFAGGQPDRPVRPQPSRSWFPRSRPSSHAPQDMSAKGGIELVGQCTSDPFAYLDVVIDSLV